MAINFPATPTLNQTYTYNGRTWTYNGVGWQATGASGLSVYTKTDFTATAAQTTFTVAYTVGFVDVYYNGSKLSITEYTATNGTSVVLGTACAVNDIVETVAWTVSTTLNPALGVATATSLAIGGATIGSNALAVTGTTALSGLLTAAGGVSSTLTTDATSTTTGSIITAGGISTQKALFVGTTSNFAGTMTAAAANFSGLITGSAKAVINPAATPTTAATATQLGVGEATNNSSYRLNLGYWVDSGVYRGNIDAITGGTAATLTLNSTGGLVGIGMTPSNVLDITQTQNAGSIASLKNASTGVSGLAYFSSKNSISNMNMAMFSTGYSPSGMVRADGGYLGCNGAGGITINTEYVQPIYFGIGSTEAARFDTSGNLKVGTSNAADRNFMYKAVAQGSINFHVLDGNQGSAIFLGCSNAAYNAANAAIWVSQNSATSRSINAGGTINASGADYAEYMTKADGCDLIAKGAVVGVNADGKLTDKFADAHSFVVKSTDPSYVGGDVWGSVDIMGVRPEFTDPAYTQYAEKLEAARQTVDRIAFSGQVPVNVTGATVGDYIVPVAGPDGGIAGEAVTNPTFDQYRAAVGRVWKTLEDGRAFVSVKVS